MPENLSETANFDPNVSVPVDGVDRRTALSLRPAFQALANRTRWLQNTLQSLGIANRPAGMSVARAVAAETHPELGWFYVGNSFQGGPAGPQGLIKLVDRLFPPVPDKVLRVKRIIYHTITTTHRFAIYSGINAPGPVVEIWKSTNNAGVVDLNVTLGELTTLSDALFFEVYFADVPQGQNSGGSAVVALAYESP